IVVCLQLMWLVRRLIQPGHQVASPYGVSRPGQLAPSDGSTLSLHDALPIYVGEDLFDLLEALAAEVLRLQHVLLGALKTKNFGRDRKSTRLNSSHVSIWYGVFCLKKNRHNGCSQ